MDGCDYHVCPCAKGLDPEFGLSAWESVQSDPLQGLTCEAGYP
jgi:hypothetical protein